MVDALPKILVANRNKLTESLPLPIVFAPLAELTTNAPADVSAAGDERHASRAINCLEAADHREQLQAASARIELRVIGRELLIAANRLQRELPMCDGAFRASRFGVKQKMIRGGLHLNKLNGWACIRSGKVCWPTSNASRSETIEPDQFVSSANNPECIKLHSKNAQCQRDDRTSVPGLQQVTRELRDRQFERRVTLQTGQTLYSTRSEPAHGVVLTYANTSGGARTARSCHALCSLSEK